MMARHLKFCSQELHLPAKITTTAASRLSGTKIVGSPPPLLLDLVNSNPLVGSILLFTIVNRLNIIHYNSRPIGSFMLLGFSAYTHAPTTQFLTPFPFNANPNVSQLANRADALLPQSNNIFNPSQAHLSGASAT
ncbi:hypothetical protein L2E82_37939 [Cichorium intybus]|uniref:Uncharacterized protein n=1 Tax=Cichorium intybus TaxID=13427 RepID=A0ACB9AGY0_CICIN|nr:hypothetical protein L2E82_37939 [Cichorium intybus]